MLLLSFIFVYYYGGDVPYILFYSLLLLPCISFLYTILVCLSFNFTLETDKEFIIKGTKLRLTIKTSNKCFLFHPFIKMNLFGTDLFSEYNQDTLVFSLYPFTKKDLFLDLDCNYRGCYTIGVNSVEFTDLLGLIKIKRKKKASTVVTVCPRVLTFKSAKKKESYSEESSFSVNKPSEDMLVMSDVRKYAMGDPLKKIHWKLTAKTSEIIVKNYHKSIETKAVLALDLMKNNYSLKENIKIEDKLIESLVSVLYHYISNNAPVSLVFNSGKEVVLKAESSPKFNDMYKILSGIEFNSAVGCEHLLGTNVLNVRDNSNIILFTSNINQSIFKQLYNFKCSGHNPKLVYTPSAVQTTENTEKEGLINSLRSSGIRVCTLEPGQETGAALEKLAL
ncbi:MAG: DUF58 domain-containing protein [Bacillota bacterium]|nr:DUF58 domain-containing protein [Bacillota bacterium]